MVPMHDRRTDPHQFEQYARWCVYPVVGLPLFLLLFPAVEHPRRALVSLPVVVALTVVSGWFCKRMLDACVRPRPWQGMGRPLMMTTVVTVASVGVLAGLWWRVESSMWVVPIAVVLTLVALGLRMEGALVLAFGAGGAVFILAIWLVHATATEPYSLFIWGPTIAAMVFTGWIAAWMLRVMADLKEARDAAGWLAASEERARISRDLHDLFGQTLASIAVKSELAAELTRRGRNERAEQEMRAIHALADESGERVRAVVRGYRELDLTAEVSGARAVLESAGIVCDTSTVEVEDLQVASTFAWVLREGVTNILRHSDASRAVIELTPNRLVISNDAPQPMKPGVGGLAGMRERMETIGGGVECKHEGDRFVVTAQVR